MPDTITESELIAMHKCFEWVSTMDEFSPIARHVLNSVGITVVPDPIPEPEGDVIVVDVNGKIWRRGVTGWICDQGVRATAWNAVTEMQGPVKIYRLEETK